MHSRVLLCYLQNAMQFCNIETSKKRLKKCKTYFKCITFLNLLNKSWETWFHEVLSDNFWIIEYCKTTKCFPNFFIENIIKINYSKNRIQLQYSLETFSRHTKNKSSHTRLVQIINKQLILFLEICWLQTYQEKLILNSFSIDHGRIDSW